MTEPKIAAIYTRISSDSSGEGAGVKRQKEDCLKLVDTLGWQLFNVFEDNDRGAYNGGRRMQWEDMLAAIRAGSVNAVVAWHEDRLTRNPRELEDFIDLCKEHEVTIRTPFGTVNLSYGDDQFVARIKGAVARKESDDKSRRLRRKHEDLASRGRWLGGGRSMFGFERVKRPPRRGEGATEAVTTLRVHEPQAKVLREVAARIIRGDSLTLVTKELNERGITTAEGKRWRTGILRRVLLNPALAGLRVHRRTGLVTEGEWPAILDKDVHELLKSHLNGDESPKGAPGPRRYPLSGLLTCASCKQRMLGSGGNYRCAVVAGGCGHVRISAHRVEDIVFRRVYWAWSHDDRPEEPRRQLELTKEERALLRKLQEVEGRKLKLAEEWADLGMDARQFRAANVRLEAKMGELRRRLRDHTPQTKPSAPTIGALHDRGADWMTRWQERRLTPAEVEASHAWVASYVKRVVIRPAKKRGRVFDPTRVKVEFPRTSKRPRPARQRTRT